MILRAEALKAALACVTGGHEKFFIQGIHVCPDGTVEATDGHVLVRVKDPSPFPDADFPSKGVAPFKGNPEKAVTVPASHLKGLLAIVPKKTPIPILQAVQLSTNGEEGGVNISATNLETPTIAHIEASDTELPFPNVENVMVSADRPALSVTFSVEALKSMIQAAEAVQRGRKPVTQFITVHIPTEEQYQGRKDDDTANGHAFDPDNGARSGQCKVCGDTRYYHQSPDGVISSPMRFEVKGLDLTIEGVVMPCRVG